jgi:hypothetical protein
VDNKNKLIPADDGIESVKKQNVRLLFMEKLCEEFKGFVIDMIGDGMDEGFDDHFEFMSACLETFIELKNEED